MLTIQEIRKLCDTEPVDRYTGILAYHHANRLAFTCKDNMLALTGARIHIYAIVNHTNNRMYIGMHCARRREKFNAYHGSSTYLHRSILRHTIDNFSKSILYASDDLEEIYDIEQALIDQEFVNLGNAYTYNRHIGGAHFAGHKNSALLINIKTGDKIRVTKIDVADYLASGEYERYSTTKNKTFIRNIHTDEHFYVNKDIVDEYYATGDYVSYKPDKGIKRSDEFCKNVSIGTRLALSSVDVRRKIGDANRRRSKESRQKHAKLLSNTWKTNKHGARGRLSAAVKQYFENDDNRKKTSDAVKLAMISPEIRAKCATGAKDKVHMYKNTAEKFVRKSDIEMLLADGWRLGRPKRKRMHKNGICKSVFVCEVQTYVDNGWFKNKSADRQNMKTSLAKTLNDASVVDWHDSNKEAGSDTAVTCSGGKCEI
jgi:hypothetical protein